MVLGGQRTDPALGYKGQTSLCTVIRPESFSMRQARKANCDGQQRYLWWRGSAPVGCRFIAI